MGDLIEFPDVKQSREKSAGSKMIWKRCFSKGSIFGA